MAESPILEFGHDDVHKMKQYLNSMRKLLDLMEEFYSKHTVPQPSENKEEVNER